MLVLDGLHELRPDSVVVALLAEAVREVPDGMCLCILSREPLPRAFAPLIAEREATLIDWPDLRFDEAETRAVVAHMRGGEGAAAHAIHRVTNGWAAAIRLLGQKEVTPTRLLDAADAQLGLVFDYLAVTFFDRLDAWEQRVLMRCSLLPWIDGNAGRTVSGDERTEELLGRMHRRALFVELQSSPVRGYRYHDLLRAFLGRRLEASEDAAALVPLRLIAGECCEQLGETEEAFSLFLKGGDLGAAKRVLVNWAPALLGGGRHASVVAWLDQLRTHGALVDPALDYLHGLALLPVDLERGKCFLKAAWSGFAIAGEPENQLLAAAETIRAIYFAYAGFAEMETWVARIDTLMSNSFVFSDPTTELQVMSALVLAFTVQCPGHAREARCVARAEALVGSDEIDADRRVGAGYALFDYFTMANQVARSRLLMDRVTPLLRRKDVLPYHVCCWYLQQGYHFFRSGERAQAAAAWDQLERTIGEEGFTQFDYVHRCFRSFEAAANGDPLSGSRYLQGLDAVAPDLGPFMEALFEIGCCLNAMAASDRGNAARHARMGLLKADAVAAPFARVIWRQYGAAALALAGDHEIALRWLDEAWVLSAGSWLESYRPSFAMVRAWIATEQRDEKEFLRQVQTMLDLAREGDRWIVLRALPVIRERVLEAALRAGVERQFLRRIIRGLCLEPSTLLVEHWPWPIEIRVLGPVSLVRDGEPVTFARKAQRRSLELLKVLVALGGRGVDADLLAETLWPDSEGDAARNALNMALHRLRRLLGNDAAIELRDSKVTISKKFVWIDLWALESILDRIDADDPSETAHSRWRQLRALCAGQLLEQESGASWAVGPRRRLQQRLTHACTALGNSLCDEGNVDSGIACYRWALHFDPESVTLAQRLSSLDRLTARNRREEAEDARPRR